MSLLLFVLLTIVSFGLTFLVRRLALRYSIMDVPNERSSHVQITPRGGGIAVVIVWFCGLFYLYSKNLIPQDLLYAFLCGIPIVLVGLLDDILNLKPSVRLIVQIICAGMALFVLGGKMSFSTGFLQINSVWALSPIALLLIVWFINLFNFLDGIDGYIGTEIVFLGIASSIISNDCSGYLLAAATLGFLFWNWQKAKIFMGDVGSTFLGFNIAIMAIFQQNAGEATALQWLILTSVFWFDATVTVLRRLRNKEKLSQAHRKHAYQRLVQAGFSHQKVVLGALVLNLVGFVLAWFAGKYQAYLLAFFILDVAILYVVLRWVDKKKPFEYQ